MMATTHKAPEPGDVVYAYVGSRRPMILVRRVFEKDGFWYVEGAELTKPKSTKILQEQVNAGAPTHLHDGKCYIRRGSRTIRLEALA
jgi:hypothetical protein